MMKNAVEKRTMQTLFQLFFMKNDETQKVKVTESNEINLEEVKSRLEKGESVLITLKKEQKTDMGFIAYDKAREPWYLIRS